MSGASANLLRYVHSLVETHRIGSLSNHQLLDRFAAQRDEAAFALLVRRHGPMVLGVCRRLLGHEQDAEDAFQAVFLILARKAGAIRQTEVAGYLYRVAYRIAVRARGQNAKPILREQRERVWSRYTSHRKSKGVSDFPNVLARVSPGALFQFSPQSGG